MMSCTREQAEVIVCEQCERAETTVGKEELSKEGNSRWHLLPQGLELLRIQCRLRHQ